MSVNNKVTNNNRDWNSKKLIQLSDNLGEAYGTGLDNGKSGEKADFWTTDKLISMSRNLSSAYGVDF